MHSSLHLMAARSAWFPHDRFREMPRSFHVSTVAYEKFIVQRWIRDSLKYFIFIAYRTAWRIERLDPFDHHNVMTFITTHGSLDLIRHQPARIIFVIDFLRLRDPRYVRFSYAYVRAVPGTRIDEIPNINCITMVIESAERRLFEQ